GSPAPLMLPKAAALMFAFGVLKFAWLKMLKNSARNWSFACSVIAKFLKTPISHVNDPGPIRLPLRIEPKVPAAGNAKLVGSSQSTHGARLLQAPVPRGGPV